MYLQEHWQVGQRKQRAGEKEIGITRKFMMS